MIKSIFVLLLICFCFGINAQEPVFRHYTTVDGLPSNEIHEVIQDRNGYLWFATDFGASRFDGYSFKNFGFQEGLKDQVLFDLQEDEKGRIWFPSFSGNLSYYKNGEIYHYRYDSLILEHTSGHIRAPLFHMGNHDSLFVFIPDKLDFVITPDGKLIENYLADRYTPQFGRAKQVVQLGSKDLFYLYTGDKSAKGLPKLVAHIDYKHFEFDNNILKRMRKLGYSYDAKNRLLLLDGNRLIRFSDNQQVEITSFEIEKFVTSVASSHHDNILLGTQNGVYVFQSFESANPSEQWLKGKFITDILIDNENGIWITTHHSGVYYLPNQNIKYYSFSNLDSEQNISALNQRDGIITVGLENGNVLQLNASEGKDWYEIKLNEKGVKVYGLDYDKDLLWVVNERWILGIDKNSNVVEIKRFSGKCVTTSQSDSSLYFSGYGFAKRHEESFENIEVNRIRVGHIAVNNDNEIWAGNPWGIWKLSESSSGKLWKRDTKIIAGVSELLLWNDYLLIATKGSGIILKRGTFTDSITKMDGLLSDNIRAMQISVNQLWVASDQGINVIQLDEETSKIYSISSLRKNEYLPSYNVKKIMILDSLLWLATENGLYSLNTNMFNEKPTSPILNIESVTVNGNPLDSISSSLNYKQNDIMISFVGILFKSHANLIYRFRMKGYEDNWNYTTQREVRYNNLPSGNFLFEVQSKSADMEWTDQTEFFEIEISSPFWEEWWFRVLMVLSFVGLIIFVVNFLVKYRSKKTQEKNESAQKIMELEMRALRAQMNPHFTFNTLNSIQHYIWNKDPQIATEYLANFAKLIRKLLENSRLSKIALEDELEVIKIYLDLEQLRLNNKFDYEITLSPLVNAMQLEIPTSLIQPYVENAIWHGISKLKDKGKIDIEINKVENLLLCTITDNGIGRHLASEKNLNKQRTSLGTKLTEERINLLKATEDESYNIKIIDLYTSDNKASGTQVIISIPII